MRRWNDESDNDIIKYEHSKETSNIEALKIMREWQQVQKQRKLRDTISIFISPFSSYDEQICDKRKDDDDRNLSQTTTLLLKHIDE